MSLRDLNPRTRSRLRLHGWALTGWCVALGVLTSWWLLRVAGVRVPAARYAISAVVMYAFGLVLGTRVWLARFSASVREETGVLGTADTEERVAFDSAHRGADSGRSRIGQIFRSGWDFASLADIFSGFGELAGLLFIPALILFGVALLLLIGTLPVLLTDGMAALLAEMAVQFVFGALLVRGVMRPQKHEDAFLHIVGKTWIVGVLLVLVSAIAGGLLMLVEPGAVSIGDLLRHAERR